MLVSVDRPIRTGPVPIGAIADLLGALPADPLVDTLVDMEVAAQTARDFKIDLSFAGSEEARFSVNDTGEPDAFRARLRNALGDRLPLDEFLALSPPGQVQTTVSLKWRSRALGVTRIGLYFEELGRFDGGAALRSRVFRWAGVADPPGLGGLEPGAVCVDFIDGHPVAVKDYGFGTDVGRLALDGEEAEFATFIPAHPRNGQRRFLRGGRYGTDGQTLGRKLIWMTEANQPEYADQAWGVERDLRQRWGPLQPRLDTLRAGWGHPCFLYPDLVCLNLDPQGKAQGLSTYVTVK